MNTPVVTLGTFSFVDFEIPSGVRTPLVQRLVSHDLPGGRRVWQAMGANNDAISWDGIHKGPDARTRSKTLESYLTDGAAIDLVWYDYSFSVLVRSYVPNFESPFRISFSITLEVVGDATSGPDLSAAATTDAQMRSDADAALSYSQQLRQANFLLQQQVMAISKSIDQISSFRTSTLNQINTVLTPIRAAQTTVQAAIVNASSTVKLVPQAAGVVASMPIGNMAPTIKNAVNATVDMANLQALNFTLMRMLKNALNADPSADSKTVITAPGPLAAVASSVYGDATQWLSIARATGITDPALTKVTPLIVPRAP